MAPKLQIEWQEDEQTLYELYKLACTPARSGGVSPGIAKGGFPKCWLIGMVVTAVLKGGLMPEQEAELKAKAEAGEIRTIWDGVDWARQAHQVEYTYWGMRWVFARLGLKKKVPRPRSPKASATEQEAWKKGG